MRKRNLFTALAVLAALYSARMALKMAGDLRRYNHILSLSNEGTVQEEFPELMVQVMKREKQTLKEWMNFITSVPKDIARYMKIESL
jgi:DNA-binding transcriptional regulator YbjK